MMDCRCRRVKPQACEVRRAILLPMHVEIEQATVDQVADLRLLYARELDDMIRYEREIRQGRTRIYGVRKSDTLIGYSNLHGEGEDRSTVVEFFLLPQHRRHPGYLSGFTRYTTSFQVISCRRIMEPRPSLTSSHLRTSNPMFGRTRIIFLVGRK